MTNKSYDVGVSLRKFEERTRGIFSNSAFRAAALGESDMIGRAQAKHLRTVIGNIISKMENSACMMPASDFGKLLYDINAMAFNLGLDEAETNKPLPPEDEMIPPPSSNSLIRHTSAEEKKNQEELWLNSIVRTIRGTCTTCLSEHECEKKVPKRKTK